MAYRTTHKFKIDVSATHDFDDGPSPITSVVVHVELAWDDRGRHWWDCVGWSNEGSDVINQWTEETNPLSSIIHSITVAHMNPGVIERIISAHEPSTDNVIDLQGQRRIRRLPSESFEPRPSTSGSSEHPA